MVRENKLELVDLTNDKKKDRKHKKRGKKDKKSKKEKYGSRNVQ
jgi:hypothetical protein